MENKEQANGMIWQYPDGSWQKVSVKRIEPRDFGPEFEAVYWDHWALEIESQITYSSVSTHQTILSRERLEALKRIVDAALEATP